MAQAGGFHSESYFSVTARSQIGGLQAGPVAAPCMPSGTTLCACLGQGHLGDLVLTSSPL